MKKKPVVLTLFCLAITSIQGQSPHMLVCTLKKYPCLPTASAKKKKQFNAAHTARQTQGIYASYFGYLNASNAVGQIVFPRKHHDTSFTLVVTDKIEPIFMLENTISTWRVPEKSSCAYYTVERKKDVKTDVYFWDVQKTTVPKDRIIPLDAITFIAKPEELYIPTGITPTSNNPQLALPEIFVKESIRLSDNALSVLSYRQFFESLNQSTKTEGADVQSKVVREAA